MAQVFQSNVFQNNVFQIGSVGVVINIPLGTLTLTGFNPTVVVSNNTVINVPLGTLTLTGFNPTVVVSNNTVINIPLGTLTLTGFNPTVVVTTVTDFPVTINYTVDVNPLITKVISKALSSTSTLTPTATPVGNIATTLTVFSIKSKALVKFKTPFIRELKRITIDPLLPVNLDDKAMRKHFYDRDRQYTELINILVDEVNRLQQ
jgi:hypothetical protein